jgi:hypothetical protein
VLQAKLLAETALGGREVILADLDVLGDGAIEGARRVGAVVGAALDEELAIGGEEPDVDAAVPRAGAVDLRAGLLTDDLIFIVDYVEHFFGHRGLPDSI